MINTILGTRGMAVAPHAAASQSALAVLREGGNAIEAMIAAAATVAVVYPHMNSIGGDSFYLAMQLAQLQDNPQRSLRGVTDELSLTDEGKIKRKLVMLRFENGVPEPLPGS